MHDVQETPSQTTETTDLPPADTSPNDALARASLAGLMMISLALLAVTRTPSEASSTAGALAFNDSTTQIVTSGGTGTVLLAVGSLLWIVAIGTIIRLTRPYAA